VVLILAGLNGTSLFAQLLYFPPNGSSNRNTIVAASLCWCSDCIDSSNYYLESNQSRAFVLLKEWHLLDAMGRELSQNHASFVNQFVIDASDYSNGSYLLKLLHANGRMSFQQLFKQ
jgi:hypothetical protein